MNILESKILDRRFTNLIRKALKAGYFELKVFSTNIAGTPQGSIVSPILANIFLHQLDVFIQGLKNSFDKGNKPGTSLAYKAIRPEYRRALYHKDLDKIRQLTNRIRKIDYTYCSDPGYKRLVYVRYADD
jgi:retron-type reverse transcriptase